MSKINIDAMPPKHVRRKNLATTKDSGHVCDDRVDCGKEERRWSGNSLGRHMGRPMPKCRWADGVSGRIVFIAGVLMEHGMEAKSGIPAVKTAPFPPMVERREGNIIDWVLLAG